MEGTASKSRIEELEGFDVKSVPTDYLIDHLPLQLISSEIAPPPPNPGIYTVDWLPDFAGYAWVAYGASSCLIISHFPSPASPFEIKLGPILRQTFELVSAVVAVAWSPIMSSLSVVAAASENRICLFENDSAGSHGSFCWRQTKILVHSSKVEAVTWTGSGDGIIAGGKEVVIWKNNRKSFQVVWMVELEIPHTLVSTGWSVAGPVATSPFFSKSEVQDSFCSMNDMANSVIVHYKNGNSDYLKSYLRHPQPISFIQWRPMVKGQSKRDATEFSRDILLTCCLDGTVRLWCEMDGMVRKKGGDIGKKEVAMRSFFVVGIIEINQVLNGTLGTDSFIVWAAETKCTMNSSIGDNQNPFTNGSAIENPGKCEWLVGFGPGRLLTFWAIHCIDDIFPMRFPRVTLWKQRELQHHSTISLQSYSPAHMKHSFLSKVVISRERPFGPPNTCSLVQLCAHSVLEWSLLHTQAPTVVKCLSLDESRAEELSCYSTEVLRVDGHFGRICHIKVHPCTTDTEIAASLDSDGVVLIWSFSTTLYHNVGPATLYPTCKIRGKLIKDYINCRFTSLSWLPLNFGEERVLLLGHTDGIDFFLVKMSDEVMFHKLCTLFFPDYMIMKNDPCDIHSSPLLSTCNNSLSFLLLAVWTKDFHALSWKITLHSCSLLENCTYCTFDTAGDLQCGRQNFKSNFCGKQYSIIVELYSSHFPSPHCEDDITSYALVQPPVFGGDACNSNLAYHVVTGCASGSLKFWRSTLQKSSFFPPCWQLVGILSIHKEPIIGISLSGYGEKVATICSSKIGCTIYIWEILAVAGLDNFLLEDTIYLTENIVALNWLTLGNGRLLLGVGLQNEIKIYAHKHADCVSSNYFCNSSELDMHFWFCLAVAQIAIPLQNFIWGPKAMFIAIHTYYFSVTHPWVLVSEGKRLAKCHVECFRDDCHQVQAVIDGLSGVNDNGESLSSFPDRTIQSGPEENAPLEYGSDSMLHLWCLLEVEDKLCGPLPVYHPKALLMNIYSGNLKRARSAMNNLITNFFWNYGSLKVNSNSISGDVPPILPSEYFEEFNSKYSGERVHTSSLSFSPIQQGTDIVEATSMPGASCDLLSSSFRNPEVNDILPHLEKLHESAAITNAEKMQLLAIADFFGELCNQGSISTYTSLDEPGRRFWVGIRFQQLLLCRRYGRSLSAGEMIVGSELIAWAVQSNCQEILATVVLSEESSWEEMRNFGVGFWLSNPRLVRTRMEKLARIKYLKNKDPRDCALLYVALNKPQVLASLFKISKDEKDKPLVGFLSRNFKDEKNRAAALKNAYVLMSKHQLQLAIAFFLLGGDTVSAITVCAKNLGDEQLALVICHLVEGQDRELVGYLVSKLLLPAAIEKGNCWLVSLLEWIVGNPLMAYVSLLTWKSSSSSINEGTMLSPQGAFFVPSIGEYCRFLAGTIIMKNAVGEKAVFVLLKLANWMTAIFLRQAGLAVDALESISFSSSVLGRTDHGNMSSIGDTKILSQIMQPLSVSSSNWVAEEVTSHFKSHVKLDFAMQILCKMLHVHPAQTCSCITAYCGKETMFPDDKFTEDGLIRFAHRIYDKVEYFEHKFSLVPGHLFKAVVHSLCCSGVLISGFSTNNVSTCSDHSQYEGSAATGALLWPSKLFPKFIDEIGHLLSRFAVICNLCCSPPKLSSSKSDSSCKMRACTSEVIYLQSVILALRRCKSNLSIICDSCVGDLKMVPLAVFNLFEYYVYFSFAWFQNRFEILLSLIQPLMQSTAANDFDWFDMASLEKLQNQIAILVGNSSIADDIKKAVKFGKSEGSNDNDTEFSFVDDLRWMILGVCLLKRFSGFAKRLCSLIVDELGEGVSSCGSRKNITIAVLLAEQLKIMLTHISGRWVKQLALLLSTKMKFVVHREIHAWLERSFMSNHGLFHDSKQGCDSYYLNTGNPNLYAFEKLWITCWSAKIVSDAFAEENIDWKQFIEHKHSEKWSNLYVDMQEADGKKMCGQERKFMGIDTPPVMGLFQNGLTFLSSGVQNLSTGKSAFFHPPKEICKINGELFQALCINSVDTQRAALSCSHKGIIFFSWEDAVRHKDFSDYIWSEADWPYNEWDSFGATPFYVHVGFDDHASRRGWETDPVATAENVSTRALSSHPSKPFFLAGHRNIYLWKFGKDKATSMYGVHPAADVSPLASVSSLQFDCFGYRFASCASDGTACTWQLEASRKNNIPPVESFRCFDEDAVDIAYISSRGSVIAVAGYGSDGGNVVIWDTLAPHATSLVSIVCHEGGAGSLAVFDDEYGSGSLSPIAVTGGTAGDLAVHDLRFIATGRTKGPSSRADVDAYGLLWSIPKAHLGNVIRISTIPNTRLFLTGGKDGDVKLWDARRMKLIYEWPKLHERRTFLQPTSHSYGGVIRAAVTDIKVVSRGFISCGGDGSVKLVGLGNVSDDHVR